MVCREASAKISKFYDEFQNKNIHQLGSQMQNDHESSYYCDNAHWAITASKSLLKQMLQILAKFAREEQGVEENSTTMRVLLL